jgi:hypothetical protein
VVHWIPSKPSRPDPPDFSLLPVGLLGALPLVVLTPPLSSPDESQHFLRASLGVADFELIKAAAKWCWSRVSVDVGCRQAGAIRLSSQASRVKL